MNRNHVIAITGLAFILGAGNALAQEEEDLDATITIAEAEVETPDVFMQDISLPAELTDGTASADNESVNSDGGLQEATGALENRHTALDDAAAEVAAHFAEAAQDNAENSSRAEDARPDAPGDIPVPPGG